MSSQRSLKVLMICLGNICRSPVAEAIFLDLINKQGIQNDFIVDSAGTGSWHVGKKADSRMIMAAEKRAIYIRSCARQIENNDFEKFNYILTMDNSNFSNVMKLKNSATTSDLSKVIRIQDFASVFNEKEVPDPYFGGDQGFDYVINILMDSVSGFLKSIN